MQVGDLVRHNGYLAIVICVNAYETLIKWLDDGIVEDADNYGTSMVVVVVAAMPSRVRTINIRRATTRALPRWFRRIVTPFIVFSSESLKL